MENRYKMSVTKTYSLSKHKQLIDLNGDTTNFNLTFTATSKDGSKFDVLVVDQTTLDSGSELQYKAANGTISGNIISDKNVYQNYFLILKAEEPCDVEVTVDKKEIDYIPPTSLPEPNAMGQPTILAQPAKPPGPNWMLIIAAVLVLGGGLYLYYTYKTKQAESGEVAPPVPLSATHTPVSSPSPLAASSSLAPTKRANISLLERLNNLPSR